MPRILTLSLLLLFSGPQEISLKAQENHPLLPYSICVSVCNGKSYILSDTYETAASSAAKGIEINKTQADEYIVGHLFRIFCTKGATAGSYKLTPMDPTARYLYVNGNNLTIETASSKATEWKWDATNGRFLAGTKTPLLQISTLAFRAYTIPNTNSDVSTETYWLPAEMIKPATYTYSTAMLALIWKVPSLKYADLCALQLPENFMKDASGYKPINPNAVFVTPRLLNLAKNEVCNGICKNFELTDKQPFGIIDSFTAKQASYIRNAWQDGGWESIMLPFDVSEEVLPADYQFDEFHSITPDNKIVRFTEVTSLKAHTPYLMRYTGTPRNTQDTVRFTAKNVTITPFNPATTSPFKGVYTKRSGVDKFILGIKNGQVIFGIGKTGSYIDPFRAYIEYNQQQTAMLQMAHHSALPTSATNATAELLSLRYTGSELFITLTHPQPVIIASVQGQIHFQANLPAGEHRLPALPSGHYIINHNQIIIP